MRLRSTASLWESLSRAGLESDRSLWASDTTIALAEFASGSALGERLGERPIQVRRYHRIADLEECQILFISRSESERVPEILSSVKNRPVLTVSDADGFANQGGMIQFVTDKSRIRLRINLDAAEAANLTISSKLLRVAEIVRTQRR